MRVLSCCWTAKKSAATKFRLIEVPKSVQLVLVLEINPRDKIGKNLNRVTDNSSKISLFVRQQIKL